MLTRTKALVLSRPKEWWLELEQSIRKRIGKLEPEPTAIAHHSDLFFEASRLILREDIENAITEAAYVIHDGGSQIPVHELIADKIMDALTKKYEIRIKDS